MDNELGFKEHINKVVNKANSTPGIGPNKKILDIPGQAESSLTI